MDKKKLKRGILLAVHWVIIVNFAIQIGYMAFQVFVVFNPGIDGPLFGAALDMEMDFFLKRRLYAIETWIAIGGLAIYLAITEMLPRSLKQVLAMRDATRQAE